MNLTKTLLSAVVATGVVSISSFAFAVPEIVAFMTATPAWSGGKAVAQSNNSCFSEFYGGVRNTCASVKDWQMPVYSPLHSAYPHDNTNEPAGVYGKVYIKATAGTICWLQGMHDSSTASVWYGATYGMTSGSVEIPLNDFQFALNVTCRIPQNGVVTGAKFRVDSLIGG